MRIRLLAFAALTLLFATFVTLAGPNTGVRAQDDATPEADGTPAAEEEADGETEEEAAPSARIVTLVGWYVRDESGEFLIIGPLQTNQNLVGGPADSEGALSGTVEFESEENDGLPRIEIGDSVFDAFPVYEDDPGSAQRWLFFNDDPELRPGTLVMQVEATESPAYEGAIGTATFISRSEDGTGVIVIVLNLPEE
ncbi:MAG: hypothetical protein ACRDJW_08350 [Thermomicrobiales bacterium]